MGEAMTQLCAYARRMTERYIWHGHLGIAFAAYHIRTRHDSECSPGERIYECSNCGAEITEAQGAEVDPR